MKNQWAEYRVTGDWEEHLERGSAGGIDYGVPHGTAIYMPVDGEVVTHWDNGTGGHTLTVVPFDDIADMRCLQIMHCSDMAFSGVYPAGTLIGYSGGTPGTAGAGSSDGAHVHTHAYNDAGERVPVEQYCNTEEPTRKETKGKRMKITWDNLNPQNAFFYNGVGKRKHIANPTHLTVLRKFVEEEEPTLTPAQLDLVDEYF